MGPWLRSQLLWDEEFHRHGGKIILEALVKQNRSGVFTEEMMVNEIDAAKSNLPVLAMVSSLIEVVRPGQLRAGKETVQLADID